MSAPRKIFATESNTGAIGIRNGFWADRDVSSGIQFLPNVEYIRKDLVDRLNGYTSHLHYCNSLSTMYGGRALQCTCGLTEVLKELE